MEYKLQMKLPNGEIKKAIIKAETPESALKKFIKNVVEGSGIRFTIKDIDIRSLEGGKVFGSVPGINTPVVISIKKVE